MAEYQTNFLYELDQNGNSATGKVDAQVANGAGTATEALGGAGAPDDNVVSVGEQFNIAFTDAGTDAAYGGTYTYIGHASPFSGFIAQNAGGEFFLFSNDGAIPDGTTLNQFVAEDIPVCFLTGTLIATPDGEMPVEALSIGDPVVTADGRIASVRWIGRQTLSVFFGIPEGRRPVCISAGALGENLPVRDLRLTSDHALLIDDVLVQAGALVNDTTIRRIPQAELGERFVVYHIETENHEVILAEGTPAETFIDNVSRGQFDNYAEYEARYGIYPMPMRELAQPRAMSHRQVPPTIRNRISAVASGMAPETRKAS